MPVNASKILLLRTSLVIQWLRIHLATQGNQVQSLCGTKIPHAERQLSQSDLVTTEPACHNSESLYTATKGPSGHSEDLTAATET